MIASLRPRRSALFVPAANARALEKSATLRPDIVIYDLEDSALPEEKAAVRECLRDHLGAKPHPAERLVRINGFGTPWATEDILMARGSGVDGILLPKLESAAALDEVAVALDESDAPETFRVFAMIESPRAIWNLREILKADGVRRLEGLVVGPNDLELTSGVAAGPDRAELVPWLMQIVLAAKAHDLVVLDGIYSDFRDAAGFSAECAGGRRMGFDGKTLIHPSQVDPANAAFMPDAKTLAWARAIVAKFDEAENVTKGVVEVDGRMVERLHLKQAEALIAAAAAFEPRSIHG